MADNFEAVKQEVLDDAEIRSSGETLISRLREMGHDNREIVKLLGSIPPYSNAINIVNELVDKGN